MFACITISLASLVTVLFASSVTGINIGGSENSKFSYHHNTIYHSINKNTLAFLLDQRNDCIRNSTKTLRHENIISLNSRNSEPLIETETKSFNYSVSKNILLALCLILLWICVWSYAEIHLTKTGKLLNKFPGSRPIPLLGNVLDYVGLRPEDLPREFGKRVNQFGRCYRSWGFHIPHLIIAEAQATEKIFSSHQYIDKGENYKHLEWFLGDGLITSKGEIWKEDRRLLNPSFKYQRFDGFLASFNKHGRILNAILEQKVSSGDELNLHSTFCMCTMDSISEAALGQNSSFQHNPNLKFVHNANLAFESFRIRMRQPWLVLPIIWNMFGLGRQEPGCVQYFMDTFSQFIKERKIARLNEDEDITKPFIDPMLDCRTEKHIASHIITTFCAGFETTATGLNYTLYLLAKNPEIQARVHQELDRIFPQNDRYRDVTFADLSEMKYLEMCIKESLRIYPPAPIVGRFLKSDVQLDDNLVIPKGTEVALLIYELHRDPRVFPDPEKYDPDRFLPEACSKRSLYSYVPFSIGPRSCIGQKYAMMQMKVLTSNILRNFSVSSSKDRETLKVAYGIVLEPKGGIPLLLTKRSECS